MFQILVPLAAVCALPTCIVHSKRARSEFGCALGFLTAIVWVSTQTWMRPIRETKPHPRPMSGFDRASSRSSLRMPPRQPCITSLPSLLSLMVGSCSSQAHSMSCAECAVLLVRSSMCRAACAVQSGSSYVFAAQCVTVLHVMLRDI